MNHNKLLRTKKYIPEIKITKSEVSCFQDKEQYWNKEIARQKGRVEELTKTVQDLMDEKQNNQSNVADREEVEELQAEVNRLKTVYVWLFCYLSHPYLTHCFTVQSISL